jgi:hypothetical protein
VKAYSHFLLQGRKVPLEYLVKVDEFPVGIIEDLNL